MAIKIIKDQAGTTALVEGIDVEPIPLNAFLCSVTAGNGGITIFNPEAPDNNGDPTRIMKNVPFTEFVKSDGTIPVDAADLKADIDAQLEQPAPTDVNTGYKGGFNATTNIPDLLTDINDYANGDWFFVTEDGDVDLSIGVTTSLKKNDIVKILVVLDGFGVEVSRQWDVKEDQSIKVADIEGSSINSYDIVVDSNYTGTIQTGSSLQPYTDLSISIANSNENDIILIKGIHVIVAEIVLPHSLSFYGIAGESEIKYASYNASNGDIFSFEGDMTQEFIFKDIVFRNAGVSGLDIRKTNAVELRNCKFYNNGWDGTGLHTVLPSSISGVLGYDSTNIDLQAYWNIHNPSRLGGAVSIEECTKPLVRECRFGDLEGGGNFRGLRLQDCGVNGGGFVIENQSIGNIESAIYLAAGITHLGCQNITVTINYASYNANNGLLCIGGINNKFSQNEVNGNWNAGFCAWGAVNVTLRDSGLYDNNRSEFNGIGNTGDAMASIQINDAYSFINTQLTYNPAMRFIAEILDTQVHYTGLGSNTSKVGFTMTEDMGLIPDNDKNIIKIDDVGFIGQDFAIDLSEVNVSNLRLSLGDNSYQSIVQKAVKAPLLGNYSELPFSNHVMAVPSVDIVVDTLKQIISLHEGVGGNVVNVYNANELQSVVNNGKIDFIQKGSDKIQLRGNSLGSVYINGVAAGTNLVTMNDSVNAAFSMSLIEYKSFLESEIGITGTSAVHYVIESPDGNFEYPLFKTQTEANAFDNDNGGTGTSSSITYVDDLTNTTWYHPTNLFIDNGTVMPVDGIYGNSTNVVWNVHITDTDTNHTPNFTDVVYTVGEGDAVNIVYKSAGDTNTYNITNVPSGLADNGTAIIGTAQEILDGVDVQHILNVTKANDFGSDTGTITLNVTDDPTNNSLTTPWTKGLMIQGTNEFAFQQTVSSNYNPIQMDRKGVSVAIGASGKTSNDTNARPWAVGQVVKIDSAHSHQNFWSQGESYSTQGDAITFYKQGGNIKLYWGRSTGHVQAQFTAPANGWYGYYVEHGGYRETDANVTEANLNNSIRIKQVNLATGVVTNVSLAWNTGNLGDMTKQLSGTFMIGWAYTNLGNSNNGLKIASTVVTTLKRNQDKPTDTEISMLIRDPKQWLIDYKEGNDYRASSNDGVTANFQVGHANSTKGTSVWLMGDGPNDSFSNMIRNQVKTDDQNNTLLRLQNMQASDITNVTIPGLS